MCLDCGCHEPSNEHQDPRHIVLAELRAAAQANGIGLVEAAQRILDEAKRITAERMLGTDETR